MRRAGITHRMIMRDAWAPRATEPGPRCGAEPNGNCMLTINEIFYSIQGESSRVGQPCVFVRLTACDLRCSWCDTPYAFDEGRKMSVEAVMAAVERYACPLVEITG